MLLMWKLKVQHPYVTPVVTHFLKYLIVDYSLHLRTKYNITQQNKKQNGLTCQSLETRSQYQILIWKIFKYLHRPMPKNTNATLNISINLYIHIVRKFCI